MRISLVYSGSGDRVAMYLDGKKVEEGHSIPLDTALSFVLGKQVMALESFELPYGVVERTGEMPDTIDEAKELLKQPPVRDFEG